MKWVDARTQNGRLKLPRLEELYSRCFPGETFPAHDALEDVKAVARCLPVILAEGLVELKVKEYPEEKAAPAENAQKCPQNESKQETDKLPIQQEKGPQNENSPKISGVQSELLEQNDF